MNDFVNKAFPEVVNKLSTCPHFPLCPSCSFSEEPPIYLEAKHYFEQKGFFFPLYKGEPIHWRIKAKLAIREKEGKIVFGLFEPGTHEILDSSKCSAHAKPIELALEKIKEKLFLPAYKENGTGLLRYIQLHVQRETEKVQVALVVTKKDPELLKILDILKDDELFHSIWLNIHPKISNTIFSDDWIHFSGEKVFFQKILDLSFAFHPASFSQVNIPLFEKMLLSIKESLPQNVKALELYAGNGVISLSLIDQCQEAFLVEKNPYSFISFQETIKGFPQKTQEKVVFCSSSLEELQDFPESDTLLVDPPRKGLQNSIPDLTPFKRIIYISCHFPSFAQDSEKLEKMGFSLKKAEGYLFFPGSNHIEILGIFERE